MTPMRAVSLFSGVGGFEIGFERAGIETVLQAERDPWCLRVLARHWPQTERVTDVRDVGAGFLQSIGAYRPNAFAEGSRRAAVDLVYGGFPCQPFSVAGKRAGDRDDRNLWPEFRRVVRELRPRWVVAENVPGLLSFDNGRFFGDVLADLADLGFDGVAYAVLDAQHFGVPQRRRRVFVVAGPTRRACEQVLSLCESCGGNPPPRRAAGQDVAVGAAPSADIAGTLLGPDGGSRSTDLDGMTYIPEAIAIRTAQTGSNGWGVEVDGQAYTLDGASQAVLANPLGAHHHRQDLDNETYVQDTAYSLTARASNDRPEAGSATLIASAVSASAGHHGHSSPRGDGSDNLIASTLRSSEGRGYNSPRGRADDNLWVQDTAYALAARNAKGVSLLESQDTFVVPTAGVRRLTPLECERLMGWPDSWTRYAEDGTEISDSHRYRMCGNGVVATGAEWLGRRLVAVAALT